MANPSDLVPSQLKPAWTDGSDLKRALTRSGYSGGTPSSASDLKPSLLNPDGTLKESLLAGGSLKSSLTGIAGSSGGGFDADASDYFARAEALGGSFDNTATDPTYTETYTKQAISDFIAGCKTDGVWDKLTECYLLAGTSFDGLTAKLKYDTVATLTNSNFVSGDYVAAGSGAGLKGDGSTKSIDTGFADSDFSGGDDCGMGVYRTERPASSAFANSCGMRQGAVSQFGFERINASLISVYMPRSDASANINNTEGHAIISRRGVNDAEAYENGVSVVADTSTAARTTGTLEYYLYCLNDNGGKAAFSNERMSFFHFNSGLTDTEAANLSTRVNDLMTALGANTY